MGRPRKDATNTDSTGSAGDGYLSASYVANAKRDVFSLSPVVDQHLGGGILSGSSVLISGHEGLGKTTAALQIGADAQKKGRIVVYCDVEERFKELNCSSVKGLDTSPDVFKLIASSRGDIIYAQQQMQRCEKAMNDFPGCVCIIDSLSSLVSQDSKGEELGKGFQLSVRKIEGDFYKRVAALKRVNDCTVIAIAHIAQNVGSPGYHDVTAKYSQYAADVKLTVAYPGTPTPFLWKVGDKVIGHHVKWEIDKSAMGQSNTKCIGKLRYGVGFDRVAEIVQLADSLAIIEKSAAWYTVPGVEKKLCGMEQVCEYLEDNPKVLEDITKRVRELLYEG